MHEEDEEIQDYYNAILDELVKNLQKKIDEKNVIYSSIMMFYENINDGEKDEVEQLRNYGEDDNKFSFSVAELTVKPPFSPSTNSEIIRLNNTGRVPIIVASIEKQINNYNKKMDNFYLQFKSQKISPLEEVKFIIRLESYKMIKKNQYTIKNGKLVIDKELESDGKIFLPYLN